MKICSQCGTVMADEYNVCSACGMVLPAAQPAQEPQPVQEAQEPQPVQEPAQPAESQPAYVPPAYVPPVAPQPVSYIPVQMPKVAVSMWGWIGRYALNLIPLVGGLVYFIMLFVWAFDSKYDDTSRNWAKAQLLITAVAAVLTIVLVVVIIALGFGATRSVLDSGYYY